MFWGLSLYRVGLGGLFPFFLLSVRFGLHARVWVFVGSSLPYSKWMYVVFVVVVTLCDAQPQPGLFSIMHSVNDRIASSSNAFVFDWFDSTKWSDCHSLLWYGLFKVLFDLFSLQCRVFCWMIESLKCSARENKNSLTLLTAVHSSGQFETRKYENIPFIFEFDTTHSDKRLIIINDEMTRTFLPSQKKRLQSFCSARARAVP